VIWERSNRFDPRSVRLADRHYSRQKPGTPQFVRAGYNIVLITPDEAALWVTVYQPFVDHRWDGAWECSLFRNENREKYLASDLIREALAATRAIWGDPPKQGLITTVNADKVKKKRDPGRCFIRAGFKLVGETTNGLLVFQIEPVDFPPAEAPIGFAPDLFGHTKHLKTKDEYSFPSTEPNDAVVPTTQPTTTQLSLEAR
jgi:hypothetical protein